MPDRQYVARKFRSEDARSYTYHNDGEPVAVGDLVKVADRSGDGWKRVEVVTIADAAPSFPTKPILGVWGPAPEDALETEAAAPAAAPKSDPLDAEIPW